MDINTTQILFQLINFSVVLGGLTYLLYRPILGIFEERAKRVSQGQAAAQKALNFQAEIEELKKQAADEAKAQKTQVLKEARAQAKKQAAQIVSGAQQEAKELKAAAQKEWKAELAKLRKSQSQEIADLAVAVYTATHGKLVDTKTASKVIDTELAALLKTI